MREMIVERQIEVTETIPDDVHGDREQKEREDSVARPVAFSVSQQKNREEQQLEYDDSIEHVLDFEYHLSVIPDLLA
jgi:hypothetical protein